MEIKMVEKRREITSQMVTDAVQKDKEMDEKEVELAMDRDANLPTSSDEDEIDICSEEKKPANVKR